jgi:hypothetical protein
VTLGGAGVVRGRREFSGFRVQGSGFRLRAPSLDRFLAGGDLNAPQKGVRHPVNLGAVKGAAASGSLFKVVFAFPRSIIGEAKMDLYVIIGFV